MYVKKFKVFAYILGMHLHKRCRIISSFFPSRYRYCSVLYWLLGLEEDNIGGNKACPLSFKFRMYVRNVIA